MTPTSHIASRTVKGTVAVIALGAAAAALACGSSGKDRTFDDTSAAQPAPPGSLGGPSGDLGKGSPEGGVTDDNNCAAQVTTAQRAQVDIVVVIDTSGSMAEETAQVKANINTFASKIGSSGLDYTVVMIAEKPPSFPFPPGFPIPGMCVPAPLGGASCADNPPVFHQVNEAVGSTDSLSIILSKFGTYEPWLRASAFKVFIEVTDDNSTDVPFASFDQQLLAKSPMHFGTATNRRYVFNSICGWKKGTPVLSADACGTAVNTGDQYQQLSKLTGGIVDSVCETDYSGVFDNIAKGLVKKLGCEFSFPKSTTGQQTDPSRVAVHYTPGGGGAKKTLTQVTDASKCASIPDAWYYDDNSNPTKILFCPTTCTAAGGDTDGKLEVAVGCKAPPPK
ncbi:MAG: hypothetical protein JWP87_2296 [Labilithrix sp.]|nr:hypothetical protein [Labilithrix sp.]